MAASPEVTPTTSVGDNPFRTGFFGTYISLPGLTAGWLLKNRNFLVPFTVPLGYTI
jgi:hypothetical protein